MARIGAVAVVAGIGCSGEPPDGAPPSPEAVEVTALRIAGEDCSELDEATFIAGGQGGFHAELGLVAETPTGGVRVTVDLADAATGERIGGWDGNFLLAGWSEEQPVGWVTDEARLGSGVGGRADEALFCSMVGRSLVVTACAEDVVGGPASCTAQELPGWFDDPGGICR
jgi:hypothetical protein